MMRCIALSMVLVIAIFSCSRRAFTHAPESNSTLLFFSGYYWQVSHATTPSAPGPNFWNRNNVWIDKDSALHLAVTKDANGTWSCASLKTTTALGLGTYEFEIAGDPAAADPNIVLGLFNYSGKDQQDEMDIEFSRWGNAFNNNLHYAVYPNRKQSTHWSSETLLTAPLRNSVHRFIRTDTTVLFESRSLPGNELLASAVYRHHSLISKKAMPVHINHWLFRGKAPSDQKAATMIIRRFRFIPL